jgi:hypothetical protein
MPSLEIDCGASLNMDAIVIQKIGENFLSLFGTYV